MERKLHIPSKLTTESTQEAEKDLIEVKKETALAAFETGEGLDELIEMARKTVADFEHDMSTASGRKRSASLAYKVSRFKVRLDNLRKGLVSDKKELIKKVDQNGKYLRDSLDEVRDNARRPLDKWEAEEEARTTKHLDNLLAIGAMAPSGQEDDPVMSLADLESNLDRARNMDIGDSWEEFKEQALEARHIVTRELEQCIANEKNRLELYRLLKEKEERELKEATERAERERLEKERKRAEEEKQRIEAAKKEAAELAAKLEREKQLAHFREEEEKAAKIRREEIAKAEKELKRRQDEKEAAVRKAKEAEEKAKKAEFDRMVAEAQAKANADFAAKQAVLDEQKRIADLNAKEEAKQAAKEANKKHVARIDKEVFDSLIEIIGDPFGNPEKLTDSVLAAIKEGNVKHVTIKY